MRKLRMHELQRLTPQDFKNAPKTPVVVVLDNVRSLLNVGSVFRTADAFRLEAIFLCGVSPQPTKEMNKTALGATDSVTWHYREDSKATVKELRSAGYRIIAIEQTSSALPLNSLTKEVTGARTAVIFGNEVTGVSDELLPLVDSAVEIPQWGTKHSLNVAVSAGIALWEICKYHKSLEP